MSLIFSKDQIILKIDDCNKSNKQYFNCFIQKKDNFQFLLEKLSTSKTFVGGVKSVEDLLENPRQVGRFDAKIKSLSSSFFRSLLINLSAVCVALFLTQLRYFLLLLMTSSSFVTSQKDVNVRVTKVNNAHDAAALVWISGQRSGANVKLYGMERSVGRQRFVEIPDKIEVVKWLLFTDWTIFW